MNPLVSRTVKIGVTGSSKINSDNSIKGRVKNILLKIDDKLSKTPYQLIVISPLARGADRVLTQTIIEFNDSKNLKKPFLEIISQDILKNEEDSEQLNRLIDFSQSKRTLNEVLNDKIYEGMENDYQHAGQLVVDKCDCLIAVWDEKESLKGHTSQIVNYARLNSIPIFIINPNNPELTEEYTEAFWDDLEYLNRYNDEIVNPEKLKEQINKKNSLLDQVDLNNSEKDLIKNNIITPLAKANIMAMHYQKWHYISINMVYYFSAGAVAIVALQLLFLPDFPQILIAEAAMMIIIILLYLWNKKQEWHRKWIDYRYLAERLRAATIFAIAGLECNVLEHLPHQRSGDDWTLQAYNSIYQKQMVSPCKKLDFEQKRRFVLDNWIKDQEKYYLKKSVQHHKTEKFYNYIIYGSFGLTAIFALIHAMGVFWHVLEIPIVSEIMTLLVIILPAIAASCAGIKTQHEYLRISKRYSQMADYLKAVQYKIKKLNTNDEENLVKILENANKMMLREHQDWRAIFSVRDAELP